MSLAQIVIVTLAGVGVARAYAGLGLVCRSLKWLNEVVSCSAGLTGAWIALHTPALQHIALVVSLLFSMAALTLYHLLRWYFDLLHERTHPAGTDGEAEHQFFAM